VSRSDIPALARTAILDPCLATNPRKASVEEIERMYLNAF